MCWTSREFNAKVSDGKIVYKILKPSFLGIFARANVIRKFKYRRNKVNPKVNILPEKTVGDYYYVYKGYHSYNFRPHVKALCIHEDVYRMEIPKGTIYYEYDDYIVSESIIMRERVTYNQVDGIPLWIKLIDSIYDFFTRRK